ncbi:methylmalonyl Co-A mutase-associated GTPase MeaB [Spirochaetota bacterium]
MSYENAKAMAERIKNGDSRAIARLITLIEAEDPNRLAVLKLLFKNGGNAHVIGVTGPPGAGKSTLTDKLVDNLRKRSCRVAVLAVDPSSPFTGGAILGDRIRMQQHALDDGVYIRSLATRGHLGGLSRAVSESVRLLDSANYDFIIIETVGVGQSEVDIVRIADTIVLVSVPGLGDDIQAIKAGVMEIGDIFIVNKADRDGAERVIREIKVMLETAVLNNAVTRFTPLYNAMTKMDSTKPDSAQKLAFDQGAFHHIAAHLPLLDDEHHASLMIPPVLPTIAESGLGIAELVDAIMAHKKALVASGFINIRREENLVWELGRRLADRILDKLDKKSSNQTIAKLARSVLERDMDFYDAMESMEHNLDI